MKLGIAEILDRTSKLKDRAQQIELLRKEASGPLYQLLKYAFDPKVKWELPEGAPPYKPSEAIDQQGRLYQEARRLYLFLEGGSPNLKPLRREVLFIQLLEGIDPADAKLLVAIKDKTMPYPGITEELIREAFPGLIEQNQLV
jgi:hypothetical protein